MSGEVGVLATRWEPAFRHSAGRRGSEFIQAMRDDHQLLGWKTERLGVTVPPVESGGPGEWVKVGPGASLIGYAPADRKSQQETMLAAVKIDGADTMTYVRVACDLGNDLRPGMRLVADFGSTSAESSSLPSFRPVAVSA